MSARTAILEAQDIDLKKLPVPEWNTTVYIKSFTNAEAEQFGKLLDDDDSKLVVKGFILGVCDKDGNPLFTEEDVSALQGKKGKVLARVFNEVVDFNRTDPSEDDKKNS